MGLKIEQRWVKLNPIDGNFIEFKNKADCPNKPYRILPLHSIQSIAVSSQKWLMKKTMFYWEIDNKYIM